MAKQVCDIKSTQGIAAGDSKEQTRTWSPKQMELRMANQNLNYDFTRSHLNFEIVDGEVKKVDKNELLDDSIRNNLKRRGIAHPDEAKSHVKKGEPEPEKMKRNVAARMILGGSTDRMNEIAFGGQAVNFKKGSDNSHIKRTEDVEKWAKDEYAWLENEFGKGSVARFVVHLDESWVHAHATVIPTATIKKKERVSWRQVFGGSLDVSRLKWKKILDDHYDQVGKQWGLERGDPVTLTGAKHRSTRDYQKDLIKENAQLEQRNGELETQVEGLEADVANLENDKAELQQQYDELQQQHGQLSGEHSRLVTEHAALTAKTENAQKNLNAIAGKVDTLTTEMGKQMKAMKSLSTMIENKMAERTAVVNDMQTAQAQRDSGEITAEEYEAIVAETNAKTTEFDAFIKGKTDSLTDVGTKLLEKQSQLDQLHTDYDTLIIEVDEAKKFKKDNGGLMKRMEASFTNFMAEKSLLDTAKKLNAIPDDGKVEGLSQLAAVLKQFADGYPEQLESAKSAGYRLGYNARNNEFIPEIERLRGVCTNLDAAAEQTQNANLSALIDLLHELALKRKQQLEDARTQGKEEGKKAGRDATMEEISIYSGRNWPADKMPSPQRLGEWYRDNWNNSQRLKKFEKEYGELAAIPPTIKNLEDKVEKHDSKIKQLRSLIPSFDKAIDAIRSLFDQTQPNLTMKETEPIWRILSTASTMDECKAMAHQLVDMAREGINDPFGLMLSRVNDAAECVLEVAENVNPLSIIFSLIPDVTPSVGGGGGNNELPRKKDEDDERNRKFCQLMSGVRKSKSLKK